MSDPRIALDRAQDALKEAQLDVRNQDVHEYRWDQVDAIIEAAKRIVNFATTEVSQLARRNAR